MTERKIRKLIEEKRKYFWWAGGLTIALDQLSKFWLASTGETVYAQVVIPGLLNIVGVPPNTQGAFSLGPESPLFYVLATVVGLGLIGWFFLGTPSDRALPFLSLGCLAGGAVGNLIDRLIFGGVRDFIDAHWFGRYHWPAFNVADIAICVGVAFLFREVLFGPDSEKQQENGARTESE